MKVVPPDRFGRELRRHLKAATEALEASVKFRALDTAYEFAIDKAPKRTGKAAFGLNPTWSKPQALNHGDRPSFPLPGRERIEPLRRSTKFGESGYLTFHAWDSRGVYDYAGNDAGRSLETGWSPKARDGVIGPTQRHVESNAAKIVAGGVRDAEKQFR